MRIGFIGAGKVGTAFGTYLKSKGFDIAGYYDNSLAASAEAARLSETRYFQKDFELVVNVDTLFITTTDEQIKPVVDKLAARGILKNGQVLIHMSGALSSDILRKAKEKGCHTYSMHPIQSFADTKKALEDLQRTVFSIEGDNENLEELEDMLKRMGNPFFRIKAEDKVMYHAAACTFSNYLVTLMDQGLNYLNSIGINREEGFKAMLPLIEGTLTNIGQMGTDIALTGPISRGDVGTVVNHMESINRDMPENLEFYRLMALKTMEIAKRSKLKDNSKIQQLEVLLKNS